MGGRWPAIPDGQGRPARQDKPSTGIRARTPTGQRPGRPAVPRRWHHMKTDTGTGATSHTGRARSFSPGLKSPTFLDPAARGRRLNPAHRRRTAHATHGRHAVPARYELPRQAGRGGMGEVYRARAGRPRPRRWPSRSCRALAGSRGPHLRGALHDRGPRRRQAQPPQRRPRSTRSARRPGCPSPSWSSSTARRCVTSFAPSNRCRSGRSWTSAASWPRVWPGRTLPGSPTATSSPRT